MIRLRLPQDRRCTGSVQIGGWRPAAGPAPSDGHRMIRRRGHDRSGRRIAVRRTLGLRVVPSAVCGPLVGHGDLDQVVGWQDRIVAQRGKGVHGHPLRWLGDQPEHLLPER